MEEFEEEDEDFPVLEDDEEEEYSPFSKDEVDDTYEPEEYLKKYVEKRYNYPENEEVVNNNNSYGDISSNSFVNEVIRKESGGNPNAVSNKGAIGKMQIMASALKDYNDVHKTNYRKQDLFDGDLNEHIGTWYLQKRIPAMLGKFKIPVNRETVLASYNGGIGRVVNNYRQGTKLPEETRNYIKQAGGYSLLGSQFAKHKDELIKEEPNLDWLNKGVSVAGSIYDTIKTVGSNIATGLSNGIDAIEQVTSEDIQRNQQRKNLQRLYDDQNQYEDPLINNNKQQSYLS